MVYWLRHSLYDLSFDHNFYDDIYCRHGRSGPPFTANGECGKTKAKVGMTIGSGKVRYDFFIPNFSLAPGLGIEISPLSAPDPNLNSPIRGGSLQKPEPVAVGIITISKLNNITLMTLT